MIAPLLLLTSLAADFEILDAKAFAKLFPKDAKVERLATGMQFIEGPVWITKENKLIFSDIPANEMREWTRSGGVKSFRKPTNNTNGNTVDKQGRLLSAEHTAHRVSRTLADGKVETVVESFEGKSLNSPNDVVVRQDGTIWFTDPDYGLGSRKKEQPGNYVYRFDPKDRSLTAVIRDFVNPNGLCFAPGDNKLYVADSGTPRHIRVFQVGADGKLVTGGEVFAKIDKGGPDGIRCDRQGNVWSSTGDGAQIFAPDGHRIARVLLPEGGANVELGGGMLFITARTSLYAVPTKGIRVAGRP